MNMTWWTSERKNRTLLEEK